MTATLLDPAEVFAAFWAVALKTRNSMKTTPHVLEGRDPEQFDGYPAAEYGPKYRAAIDSICAQSESILAELDLNRYPRGSESSLSDIFGSDLYMTSHGHGVGFWDSDWGPAGDALDNLSSKHLAATWRVTRTAVFSFCDVWLGRPALAPS